MTAATFNAGAPAGTWPGLAPENSLQGNSPTVAIATDQLVKVVVQAYITDMTVTASAPSTVGAASNWTSGTLLSNGAKIIAAAVTSSQIGSLNIQRYLDAGGVVAQGPVLSAPIVGGIPALLNILDDAPFQSFTVQITNTGGITATLTNFVLVLQGV